jgi:hypothetical protein
MVQNKYPDFSYYLEGLFIGKYGPEKYTTNRAKLDANYDIRIVSLIATITSVIVFFELVPERSVWSIPVKPEEEHMLAVPGPGSFFLYC